MYVLQENGGFINEEIFPEDEDERIDYYAKLHRQVWNIPRNFLDVHSDIIGKGKFGNVYKGTVQQRGFPVPATVYSIAGDYSKINSCVLAFSIIACDRNRNYFSFPFLCVCRDFISLYLL